MLSSIPPYLLEMLEKLFIAFFLLLLILIPLLDVVDVFPTRLSSRYGGGGSELLLTFQGFIRALELLLIVQGFIQTFTDISRVYENCH